MVHLERAHRVAAAARKEVDARLEGCHEPTVTQNRNRSRRQQHRLGTGRELDTGTRRCAHDP